MAMRSSMASLAGLVSIDIGLRTRFLDDLVIDTIARESIRVVLGVGVACTCLDGIGTVGDPG